LFHGTNLGNEATLEAVLVNLRKRVPSVSVICVSPSGSAVEAGGVTFVPIETLPIGRALWRFPGWGRGWLIAAARLVTERARRKRAASALRGVGVFLVAGTGVMEDYGQGSLDLPMSMLRWTLAARSAGAHVVYSSVGAGPIMKRLSRRLLLTAARAADSRSYRDTFSLEYMRSLGLDVAADAVVPDLAFSLPQPRGVGPSAWPPKVIGVGVMAYRGWHRGGEAARRIYEAYINKLASFVDWLGAEGYRITLLIGDTRADPPVIDDLLARLAKETVVNTPAMNSFSELISVIGGTDLVVATRYHNLLLAMLAEKPTIALSYSDKCTALLDWAGLADYCQNVEQLDVDRLRRQFGRMIAEEPPIHALREANARARSLLDAQYDRVAERLVRARGTSQR
jgi:polysaccharide pyruvyl transferase WcaK-like protein